LANWAWNRFKETNSMDLVHLEMEDQPLYKQRFAGRLAQVSQGFEMTEAQQLAYEQQAHDLMRQAGMPDTFYNNWHDFTNLIAQGVSLSELGTRVNDAYMAVAQAPQAIKDAMYEYYGVKGDSALAAMALDAKKAAPAIMHQIGAAEVGGYLAQQQVQVSKRVSELVATQQQNQAPAIKQGAEQIGQWQSQGIFDQRFGEASIGTAATTGVAAGLLSDAKATQKMSEQADQRAASMQGAEHFDPNRYGAGGLGSVGAGSR
jgi:hypothetical protein